MPSSNRKIEPSADPMSAADAWRARWVCLFLLVAIGLIYAQTLDHVLLSYDDSGFVFANPHVKAGLTPAGIAWAFTEGPYGEWYPLAPLSHMLDCQLFGLHAWGHHLTNVLLHAAASIGLFLVLRQMTGELWPSAFVAALFAVHPQHVESVAWVSERRDVLSGLLFMLTLGAYLRYIRHGRTLAHYLLVALLFALGLMAKPMLVTLPPLLLLLDFWPLARIGAAGDTPAWARSVERPGLARLILEKLPLVALAAADCLMTLRTHNSGDDAPAWSQRFGTAAVSCVTYIVQFFRPVDLVAFYPMPLGGPPIGQVAVAIAILAGVTTAAVIWRRRCPYLFVGWFWFVGMLSPVLGLIQVSEHAMADRYMYLPSIGLSIALAWGAARLAAGSPERRWALAAGAGLVIVVLVACAAWQTSNWYDDETLWRHALACNPDNVKAETNLAEALDRQGRRDEAIAYYQRAEQHATDCRPFNGLGALLAREGKLDEAVAHYRQALQISPKAYLVHVNLGAALARKRQFDEANQHFRRALEINPRGIEA
ncbi:MAG TPA: tetratricopeptide repeat protein, partial [Pirellulales bacterium]